jgi:hypothetical protein
MTQNRDFVAEMASIWTEPTHDNLLRAAVQFLRSGNALHQVKVGDEMMTREEVAAGLDRYIPSPKQVYRDYLDGNDVRQS